MADVSDRDTSAGAGAVHERVVSALSPGERVRIAAEMSHDAREITASGIRARHPDWPEARVRRELLTRIYGARLVDRALGAPSVG